MPKGCALCAPLALIPNPPPPFCTTCSLALALPEDGDLQRAAQQLVNGCKLLHPQRVGEVAALLHQATQRRQQAAAAAAAAAAAHQGASAPSGAVDAPQHVTEQDWETLRRQQQQYLTAAAASAIQALSAAAATASLDRLDEYLVGVGPRWLWAESRSVLLSSSVNRLTRTKTGAPCTPTHPRLLVKR